MKMKLLKWALRLLNLVAPDPAEKRWWDEEPINVIQGVALLDALKHRGVCS